MTTIMADETVEKLEAVGIETRRIAPRTVPDVIESVVEEPAVGVPLDGLAVSLEETPVTVDPTPAALKHARTGVTPASMCIAEYGSLVLPCRGDGSELVSLFVETHVVVVEETDIVADMTTAFDGFEAETDGSTDSRIIATGPSATADMGAPVEGAHGPRNVIAIVVTAEDDA